MDHPPIYREFIEFVKALFSYVILRLSGAAASFESVKSFVVDFLLVRRGANVSTFVHLCLVVLSVGVLLAGGVFSPSRIVSGSYPGVPTSPLVAGASVEAGGVGVVSSTVTPVTVISDKPRDKVIEYEVAEGNTVSSIAEEFGVSENTILWENNLATTTQIKTGQKLRVLPVTGIEHTVASGDTIYSVAKKYQANAQAIIDFPFNDIGDDFGLVTGQTLIVPDGAPPAAPRPVPTQYLARENIPVVDIGSGQFIWPASGGLAQYFSWYHPAIDIDNLGGGPIYAADSGTVTVAGWPDNYGYGNRVVIDHGNGYTTLYGHMSAIYVSASQSVSKGDVVGLMGSTGRSSGTHLHLEIRKDGVAFNPLSLLSK